MGAFTLYAARVTLPDMTTSRPIHARPVHRARYENFRALIGSDHGAISAAAAKLGKSQAQVSSFGGSGPTKNIGDDVASEIESVWGLEPGWLDSPNHTERKDGVNSYGAEAASLAESVSISPSALAEAEKWLRFDEACQGREYQPVIRAERLIALYELIVSDGGTLSPTHSEELIAAARQRQEQGVVGGRSNANRAGGSLRAT